MAILPIHTALQNPDIVGSFQKGQQFGAAMREQKRKEQDLQNLRNLAPQIQAGDQMALGQAAAISPEYAQSQQDVANGGIRRLRGAINFIEQAQKSGNPQAVEAAYQQVRPYLSRFGQEPPATFAEAAPKFEEAKLRIAMMESEGLSPKDIPSGFQQFQMTAKAAGLQPGSPEYQQAARIALGQEGRASNAGYGFFEFEGADGRKRMGRNNPRTGQRELYDETTGQFVPLGGAAAVGGVSAGAGSTETRVNIEGISPERQQQIANVASTMRAASVPEDRIAAWVSQELSTDQTVTRPGGTSVATAPAGLAVGRSPEEQAALTTGAQEAARLQYLPQTEQIKANAAIQQAAGTATAKGEAEAALEARQNLPRVTQESDNTVRLIDQALNHPGRAIATGASSRFDPRNMLPGTEARDFQALLDQIKGGTFLQAFQSLKGGGAITEVEGRKAEQAIARLATDQTEQGFVDALKELRLIAVQAKARAQRKAAGSSGPQPGTVEQGYRFKGGNPADPNSWEKL